MRLEALKNRFQIEDWDQFKKDLNFSLIIVWHGALNMDISLQLMTDLIASKDGNMLGPMRSENDPQVVDVIFSNNDCVFADNWPHPRYGHRAFLLSLNATMKDYLGYGVENYVMLGKPEKIVYEFVEKKIRSNYEGKEYTSKSGQLEKVEISNFYMIGDNPQSDIEGGNRAGWTTILVRTGIFKGPENDPDHPATYIVDDIEGAIKLIYKLEGLNIKIEPRDI